MRMSFIMSRYQRGVLRGGAAPGRIDGGDNVEHKEPNGHAVRSVAHMYQPALVAAIRQLFYSFLDLLIDRLTSVNLGDVVNARNTHGRLRWVAEDLWGMGDNCH